MDVSAWGGAKQARTMGTIRKLGEGWGWRTEQKRASRTGHSCVEHEKEKVLKNKTSWRWCWWQPGNTAWVADRKKTTTQRDYKGLLRDVVIQIYAALASLVQSQQVKGLLLGPCIACICGTGKMWTYALKKRDRRWSPMRKSEDSMRHMVSHTDP